MGRRRGRAGQQGRPPMGPDQGLLPCCAGHVGRSLASGCTLGQPGAAERAHTQLSGPQPLASARWRASRSPHGRGSTIASLTNTLEGACGLPAAHRRLRRSASPAAALMLQPRCCLTTTAGDYLSRQGVAVSLVNARLRQGALSAPPPPVQLEQAQAVRATAAAGIAAPSRPSVWLAPLFGILA